MNFIGSQTLETERLILRKTIEEDLKVLWNILLIPDVRQYYLMCKISPNWHEEEKWQYKKLARAGNEDVFQWSIVLKDNSLLNIDALKNIGVEGVIVMTSKVTLVIGEDALKLKEYFEK